MYMQASISSSLVYTQANKNAGSSILGLRERHAIYERGCKRVSIMLGTSASVGDRDMEASISL